MSSIAGRDHKISWITARTKIIYFAVWLIPFVMSAFSDRRFFSLSGRFVHFIAEHSIVGVAALLALVVFIFGKSLNNKSIKVFFWLVLLLDWLATLCMAVGMWSWVQYGYARSAIYGEEAVLYNALFWLPLFKIFGVTPSLNILMWTGKIFSQVISSSMSGVALQILRESYEPSTKEYADRNKLSARDSWTLFLFVGVPVILLIFIGNRVQSRTPGPDSEKISALFGIEYSVVPDSADTTKARELLEAGDVESAVKLLRTAVSSGDSTAAVTLGEIYRRREFAERNEAAARLIFLQGAMKGNLKALSGFARLYYGSEREKLLEFAFERGDRDDYNMQTLGLCYMQGIVLTADYLKSAHYYQIAAEEGNIEGAWQTAGFYYRGYMMERDLDKAEYWIARTKAIPYHDNFYHIQADLLLERVKKKR